jgi:hypothetical protein
MHGSKWRREETSASRQRRAARAPLADPTLTHVSAVTGPRGERQPERGCPVSDNAEALVGAFVAVEGRTDAYAQLGYPPSADHRCVSSTPGARRRPGRARATPLLRGGPAVRSGVGFPQVRKDDEGGLRPKAHATALGGGTSEHRAAQHDESFVTGALGSGGGVILALALPELACDLRQFTNVYRYVRRA